MGDIGLVAMVDDTVDAVVIVVLVLSLRDVCRWRPFAAGTSWSVAVLVLVLSSWDTSPWLRWSMILLMQ